MEGTRRGLRGGTMIVALVCVDSMIVTNPRCRLTMVNLNQSYNKNSHD